MIRHEHGSRFIGLSTDPRPQPGQQADPNRTRVDNFQVGTTLFLEDTGEILRWNGVAWIGHQPADTRILLKLDELIAAVKELKPEASFL